MSMALVVAALRRRPAWRATAASRGRAALWLLAAGFLLGWGFEVRETGDARLADRPGRCCGAVARCCARLAIVAAPVLAWAALDVGISGVVYGDPLPQGAHAHGQQPHRRRNVTPRRRRSTTTWWTAPARLLPGDPQAAARRVDGRLARRERRALAMLAVLVPEPCRCGSRRLGFIARVRPQPPAGRWVLDPQPPVRHAHRSARYWIQYFPLHRLGHRRSRRAWRRGSWRVRLGGADGSRRPVAIATVLAAPSWWRGPSTAARQFVHDEPAFAPNGGDAMRGAAGRTSAGRGFEVDRRCGPTGRPSGSCRPYQRAIFGGDKVWDGRAREPHGRRATRPPGDAVLLLQRPRPAAATAARPWRPWLEENPTVPATWELVYEDPGEASGALRRRTDDARPGATEFAAGAPGSVLGVRLLAGAGAASLRAIRRASRV